MKRAGDYHYKYDNNGNLVQKNKIQTGPGGGPYEITRYQWNAKGQMKRVITPNGTTDYKYCNGLKVEEQKGAEITRTAYVGPSPIYEMNGDGDITKLYNGGMGYWDEQGRPYYFMRDDLGNVINVLDKSGYVVQTYDYDVFGKVTNVTGPDGNKIRFNNHEWNEDTGLYYFYARWYDPENGRFISRDPIKAGPNDYVYCANNPVCVTDHYGLFLEVFGFIGGVGLALGLLGNQFGNRTMEQLGLALWGGAVYGLITAMLFEFVVGFIPVSYHWFLSVPAFFYGVDEWWRCYEARAGGRQFEFWFQ